MKKTVIPNYAHPCFLLALCLPMVAACIDMMGVNVAINTILKTFSTSLEEAQWLLSAYTIGTAAFLIIIGRCADKFGRRNVYLMGLYIFTLTSIIAGFSNEIILLIAARFFQGVASAILMMSSIAIITHSFSSKNRGVMIAKWGFALSLGMTAGPLIGGMLTHLFSWRAIFLANIPIGIISYFLINRFVPESKDPNNEYRIDFLAAFYLTAILIYFITLLSMISNTHWIGKYAIVVATPLILLSILFFLKEKNKKNPLIDFTLFSEINFIKGILCGFISYFCMYGWLFIIAIYLQQTDGFSVIDTGMICMAFSLGFASSVKISIKILSLWGTKYLILTGFILLLLTLSIMTGTTKSTPITTLICEFIFLGLSISLINTGSMTAALENIPIQKSGIASGTLFTIRWLAGSIGVVVISRIFQLWGISMACFSLAIFALLGIILASKFTSISPNASTNETVRT